MNYIKNKYLYIFFTIGGVAYYFYRNRKYNKKEIQPEIKDNFLNYFPITQEEIEESKILNKDRDYKDFKNKIINYSIPEKGETYFYYDIDDEIFNYWSNNELNYRELETITRKYCIEYDCKELYIDRKYEFLNKKELLEQIEEEERLNVDKQNSVFVKFKDYNTKKKNNVIILEDTIKFKRKGKINDYNEIIQKKNIKENSVKNKKITYKNYKINNIN